MSASDRKIRWGVVGYARIAKGSVLPAIQRSSNSVFHAVASRDAGRRADCQARFGCPRAYPDYAELLRDPEVDAVYIPLPNSLHREWTIRAAEAGKHVLCEKPIALNAAECREMIAACSARKVWLMEAFMYRYSARVAKVVEILRGGELGEIRFVETSFRFLLGDKPGDVRLQPELGGGALYDVGCYPVNFVGLVMDEAVRQGGAGETARSLPPEALSVQSVRQHGVDVQLSALLQYPTGAIAAIHCGFNAHFRVGAEIVGTKGVLAVPETYFESSAPLVLTAGDQRRTIPIEAGDRYRPEVEDLAGAILENRPPRLSLSETLRNTELIDRLYALARRT